MGDRGSDVSEDHDEKRPDQNHPVPAVPAQVNAIITFYIYRQRLYTVCIKNIFYIYISKS